MTLYTDNSARPCLRTDGVTPCGGFAPGVTGVGVNDQGPLVHHLIETAPLNLPAFTCGPVWTPVPGSFVDHPATSAVASVPVDSCVRLTTRFGRTPPSIMDTRPSTVARDDNRLKAQTSKLGDLGYQVSSPARIIGGPPAAMSVTLSRADRLHGSVALAWTTTSELDLASFDIVAFDREGGSRVVASIVCRECTTGLGAGYTLSVTLSRLRNARPVQIVAQPAGVASNRLDLR